MTKTLIRWDNFPVIWTKSLFEVGHDACVELPIFSDSPHAEIQRLYEALYKHGAPLPKCRPGIAIEDARLTLLMYPIVCYLRGPDSIIEMLSSTIKWCRENCPDRFTLDERGFMFDSPEDAALFKLMLPADKQ